MHEDAHTATSQYFKLAYVPELDGLRGIAILSVMLFHFEIPLFQGGFIGVNVFFVLSGFLITSILLHEFDKVGGIKLRYFYTRRLLRLGPALVCLLVFFCFISFMILDQEQATKNLIDALISFAYLSNWARAFLLHPPDFLGHTWSLSIEEQFYIFWPIMLLILLRVVKDRRYIILAVVLMALLAWFFRCYLAMNDASVERLYNGLDTRADALMIGCALGVWVSSRLINKKIKESLSKWFVAITPLSIVGLLVFLVSSRWQNQGIYFYGFFIMELLTAILILDVLISKKSSVVRKILAMKWLVWIGSISYGLYLWHYPIYRALLALGFDHLVAIGVGMLMAFSAATCSYYLLEKPILGLKKFFSFAVSNKDHI